MPGGKRKDPKRIYPSREGKPKKEKKPKKVEHLGYSDYSPSHRKRTNPTRYEYDLHHRAEEQAKLQDDIKQYKRIVEGQKHTDKPGRGIVEGSEQAERPHSYHRTQDPETHETTTTGKSPYLTTEGKIPHGLHGKIEELKNPKPKKDKKGKKYQSYHRFGQHPTSTGTPATHHVHGYQDYTPKLQERVKKPYRSEDKYPPHASGRPNITSEAAYKLTEEQQESKPYKAAREAETKREKKEAFEAHQRKVNPTLYQSKNPYKKGEPGYEMEEYFRSPEYKKKALYVQWLEKKGKKYQDVGPIKDQSSSEQKRQAKIIQDDLTLNARKYEGSHAEKEDEYIKNQRTDPLSHASSKSYDQIIKEAEASWLNKKRKKKLTEEQQEKTEIEIAREAAWKKDQERMEYFKKQPKDDWGRTREEGVTLANYPAEKSDVEQGKYSNPGSTPEVGVSTDTKVDVPQSTGYEERPHISVEEAGKLPRTTFNPHGSNELHVSGSQDSKDKPKFNQPVNQNQPVRKVGVPDQHPNSYGVRYGLKGGVKKVWCPEHQVWEETTKDWHD